MITSVILISAVIQSTLSSPLYDPIISLPDGQVKGTTYVTQKNTTYYGFQGIPYAAPPVGSLRFEAPQPPQPWNGVWDATHDGHGCLSKLDDRNFENEDCLFINVYTPFLQPPKRLPVMFWIYGGKYIMGYSRKSYFGPDFLIDRGVIMVSFNYRVGPFGFLSTGDLAIPGNAGLKDQSFALKWTYDNIALFGGDPEKITIFGDSAGGSSVGLHLVTSLSAGLFRAAIPQSGNTLVSFSVDENPRAFTELLANTLSLGDYVNDTQQLKRALQEISAQEINDAANFLTPPPVGGDISFKNQSWPVIEPEHEGAFLTESPYVLLESGRFNQVPILIGVTSNEAILLVGGVAPFDVEKIRQMGVIYDTTLTSIIPLNLYPNSSNNEVIIQTIRNLYLKEGENFTTNLMAVTQYISDNVFVRATIKEAELASQYVPVYLYQFSYYGRTLATTIIDGIREATHGGETPFIFNCTEVFASNTTLPEDILAQDRTVTLWTNFAQYLNPTPEESELINVTWPTYNSEKAQFLNINHTLEIQSRLRESYAGWTQIYETYGRKPFITF